MTFFFVLVVVLVVVAVDVTNVGVVLGDGIGESVVHVIWSNKFACLFVEGNCQVLNLRSRSEMFG